MSSEAFVDGSSFELCGNCAAEVPILEEMCVSCGDFAGYPNVKLANLADEKSALEERWTLGESTAKENGIQAEYEEITNCEWGLVVSIPINVALTLTTDPKNLYTNYEKLVGSGGRAAAEFANDSHRKVVSGALFGSVADKIVYGTLSLGLRGLGTYGEIFCRLKDKTVHKRTSFLEENSYDFYKKHDSNLPKGFKSDWINRGKLAAVKLLGLGLIKEGQNSTDWDAAILKSDSKNRNLDEFVEGHVYGGFNIYSIKDMSISDTKKTDKFAIGILEVFRQGRK